MSQKRIEKRSRVKPFIKSINLDHLMVTRYAVENLDLKAAIQAEDLSEVSKKKEAKKSIKKAFERYLSGMNRWFFQKLRF